MARRRDKLTVSEPKTWAAGIPGVAGAMSDSLHEMGPARTLITLRALNQRSGFDCPGCAWPEGPDHHLAEFCENGAKAVAEEATVRRIGPDFFKKHSVDDLRERDGYWLGQQGRLTHPVVKREGGRYYERIEWDAAFDLIARELKALASPDEAVFYTSGRTSNEAAFAYQLFVREFGTNNLPDCSNMCHESSGSALSETIGIGKGSVTLADLGKAELIIIAGQNPGTNHPRMLIALEKAKEHGARIVAVNSTLLLIGAFAIGAYVLKIFGLSVDIVQVAGGAVLCRLGWTLLNASPDPDPTAASGDPKQTFATRAFYPLTLPLTVDPGVLSVAIALGANHSRGLARTFILESSALIAIVLVGIAIYIAYRYAGWAASRLGHSRTQVILRLSAFIVLCIGLQIAWTGIKSLHNELDPPLAAVSPTAPLVPGSPFPTPAPAASPLSAAPAQPG